MKTVLRYARPFAGRISLGLFVKFTGTIMDLLLPWVLSFLIDEVVPLGKRELVLCWGGLMVLCSVAGVALNITANRMAARVARDMTERIRHDLFKKICSLSLRQTDRITLPSLESRLTADTYNVHQLIGSMQRIGVRAPILLLGGVAITLTLEPALTLVLFAVLPLIFLVVKRISLRGVPLYTEAQRAVDRMTSVVRENAAGVRVIRALSKHEYERERFAEANRFVSECETRAACAMAASNPLMNLFLNFGLTLVILAGAFRVNLGLTQPGKIIAFLSYFTIILNAMLSINRVFIMFSKGSASANRIEEVLLLEDELPVVPSKPLKTDAHITFDHVSFSYNNTENNLSDVTFSVGHGETLGIIGATGSGKTTVVNLLMRFYDCGSGQIRIDGRDVRSIPAEALRPKFGVVFQNDALFAETIRENVDFGRALSDGEILAAVEDAQAKSIVGLLPDGLSHPLAARGTNLSGGQRQRLLIARALAARPEILILDDASSALDYKTDAAFRKALRERYGEITTIIVAQRVSSIRHADQILVLDEGREIGLGTHSELMKECDIYREIATLQMGETEDAPTEKTPPAQP